MWKENSQKKYANEQYAYEKISDSLVVREIQNQQLDIIFLICKTGNINNIDNIQSWENWQKLSYECKLAESFWKEGWQYLLMF